MPRTPRNLPPANFRAVENAEAKERHDRDSVFGMVYARESFSWDDVDPATFLDAFAHSTSLGRAITVSLTADGGAIKVSFWQNNAKHQGYAGNAERLNQMMEALGPPLAIPSAESAD
jgi:hypothetical protein